MMRRKSIISAGESAKDFFARMILHKIYSKVVLNCITIRIFFIVYYPQRFKLMNREKSYREKQRFYSIHVVDHVTLSLSTFDAAPFPPPPQFPAHLLGTFPIFHHSIPPPFPSSRFSICVAPFFPLLFPSFRSLTSILSVFIAAPGLPRDVRKAKCRGTRRFEQLAEKVIYQTGSSVLLKVKRMSLLMRASRNLNNGFTRWLDEAFSLALAAPFFSRPRWPFPSLRLVTERSIFNHMSRSRHGNPKFFQARLFYRNNTVLDNLGVLYLNMIIEVRKVRVIILIKN